MSLAKFYEFPSAFCLQILLCFTFLRTICTSTKCWIHKFFAVFHSLMLIATFFDIIVGLPLVRKHFAACTMLFFMIGISKPLFRFSTAHKKQSPVSMQIPPNTHCSLTALPLLYLLFTKQLSSISTVLPFPPIFLDFQIKTGHKLHEWNYSSRQSLHGQFRVLFQKNGRMYIFPTSSRRKV